MKLGNLRLYRHQTIPLYLSELLSISSMNSFFPFINTHIVSHSSDSRLQSKDEVDELVSTEPLPTNQRKEKRKTSGLRMKGHKTIPSSEVAPSKTSRPAKRASAIRSVLEEDQDPQVAITKTPRRKQKMQVSKVRQTYYFS